MDAKEALDLVKKELRDNSFSEMTLINYCFFIEKFLTNSNKPLEQISSEDVQNYLSTISQKSSSTVSLATSSIKFFFTQILKKQFPDFNFPKKEKTQAPVLTKDEVKLLLEKADTKKSKLIISMLYSSGVKVSELVSIKPSDLDLENKSGIIRKPLGGSRKFQISGKIAEELKEHLKDYKGEYLFSLHQPLTTRNIQKIVKNTAKRAGIQNKITPHTLRNSFAKHIIESGVDERVVSKMLGYNQKSNNFDLEFQDQFLKLKNPHDLLDQTPPSPKDPPNPESTESK